MGGVPSLGFDRSPGARTGCRRLRVRRSDDVGRRAAIQPVLRWRRPAAEMGSRIHDAHADGLHRVASAGRSRRVPSARHPARHDWAGAWLARPRVSDVLSVGSRSISRPARLPRAPDRRARPRTSLVQSVCLADVSALSPTAPVRRIASRLERHRSRLLHAGRAETLRGPSAREGAGIHCGRDRRLQGRRGRRFRLLALARPRGIPVRPRRRADAADLWVAAATDVDGDLPRTQSAHAGSGARHERRRLVVSVCHLQRQLRLQRIHHRGREHRLRRRPVVSGSPRRRR